jgi:hypothetical protein
MAASVWFSAARLAVEFDKQRATFVAAAGSSETPYRQATSGRVDDQPWSTSRLD